MDYGIALFIYDRPQCTRQVLEALKRNHIKDLYVFQDGLGEKTNRRGWQENTDIINKIDWCTIHFEQSQYKSDSLDRQIVKGISKVLEQRQEIIVIEDDCIVSDDCISFFEKCFETYRFNEKIISIDAYLEPINLPETYKSPVIAAGVPASQAWGTWKNRWEEFQKEFSVIEKIGNEMKDYRVFDSCGYSIKHILTKYWLLGTWDLWWSIYVLVKRGISVRPAHNKVYNIGFENPGAHTAGESPWVVPIDDQANTIEVLPADIEIESWAETEFEKFYKSVTVEKSRAEIQTYYRNCLEKWLRLKQQGSSIASLLIEQGIRQVAIYGLGTICELLVNEISSKVSIKYFIVTNKQSDYFNGYPVFKHTEIACTQEKDLVLIVIPGYDCEKIKQAVGRYFQSIISLEKILDTTHV